MSVNPEVLEIVKFIFWVERAVLGPLVRDVPSPRTRQSVAETLKIAIVLDWIKRQRSFPSNSSICSGKVYELSSAVYNWLSSGARVTVFCLLPREYIGLQIILRGSDCSQLLPVDFPWKQEKGPTSAWQKSSGSSYMNISIILADRNLTYIATPDVQE